MAKKKEEPTLTPEEEQKKAEDTALIVKATALFDKDLSELANSEPDIHTITKYLRLTRANVKAAEAAGKRITRKAATEGTKAVKVENPLDQLAGDT